MAKSKQVDSVVELTEEERAERKSKIDALQAALQAEKDALARDDKAKAAKHRDSVIATIAANKANWDDADIALIARALGFADNAQSSKSASAGGTNKVWNYQLPNGVTAKRTNTLPKPVREWAQSPEGKDHFAALVKACPDFDLALDRDGTPKRGYPLHEDYVAKFGVTYEPAEVLKQNQFAKWVKENAYKDAPYDNPQWKGPVPTPTPSTTPDQK